MPQKHLANFITCLRIVCALVLLWQQIFSKWFYVFYLIGGASDVLDGLVARKLKTETKLGSTLDTIADIIFDAAVLIKLIVSGYIPRALIIFTICLAVLKCANIALGFFLHKHFVSVHSPMNKLCGILLFFIPLLITNFPHQLVSTFMATTCALATFAAIQESVYVCKGEELS